MINRQSRSLLFTYTAIVSISLAYASNAQQAGETGGAQTNPELQPIILTGKQARVKSTAADTPLATETTRETILKRDIRDLDDLGNTTEPGVSWVSDTNSVNIRGLEDDRVLTTIDGIPIPYLSDGIWGATGGANAFDFSALSAVDILRGGDSSRAGSGALGGAVLLRTLEPEDLLSPGKDTGGIVKGTYDGKDRSIGGSAAFAKKIENTSILFQGSYTRGHEQKTGGDVGGYGSIRTQADPANTYARNLMIKLRQELEGGHAIGLTAEHYSRNENINNMSNSASGSTYEAGSYRVSEDSQRTRVSLDYDYDAIAGDALIDSLTAKIYWQRAERVYGYTSNRLTVPVGTYGRSTDNQQDDYGFSGHGTSSFDTGNLHHRLLFGADLQFSQVSQYTTGVDSCDANATDASYISTCANYHVNQSNSPDVNGYKAGLFVEDRIGFTDSGLSLTPGLRFDWYKFDPQASSGFETADGYAGLPDGQSDWQISPKLRAAWQVNPDIELFAQFSAGFKAPNVNQLYLNYVSTYYQSIGNPDLESEKSYGFEVGTNLGDEDFGGRITAFSTRYKDFIDTSTSGSYLTGDLTYQYYNRSNVRISGIEARAHKRFENGINLHASAAYAYGKDMDTNELLASVAPLKAIFGIGYEQETWGTDFNLIASAAVRENSTASFKPAGYGVVNLTGWWEPEKAKGFRLQAGVYNLFDKTYFDALEVKDTNNASDLYSEAGRYFKLSLTQRF